MGRGRQLLYTAVAALALTACASKKPSTSEKAPMVETLKKVPDKMNAKWKNGDCTFDKKKMEITYTDSKEKISETIKLDTELDPATKAIDLKPIDMLCSDDFTVVVGKDYALVAQGADQIFAEFPMLGLRIDDKIEVTNSYYLDIRKITNEKIESVFVTDSTLAFITKKKIWEINLIDNSTISTER